jgi:hypothetical protein
MIGGDGDALQTDQHLDPFRRPSPVGITFEFGEWVEGQCPPLFRIVAADLIVIAVSSERQG